MVEKVGACAGDATILPNGCETGDLLESLLTAGVIVFGIWVMSGAPCDGCSSNALAMAVESGVGLGMVVLLVGFGS